METSEDLKTFGRARLSFAREAEIDEFAETLEKFERGELTADQWRAFRLLRGTYGQRQSDDQRSRDQFIRHEMEQTEDRRGRRHRADAERIEEVEDEADEHFEERWCAAAGIGRRDAPRRQEPVDSQHHGAQRQRGQQDADDGHGLLRSGLA